MVCIVLEWDWGGGGAFLPLFCDKVSGSRSEPCDGALGVLAWGLLVTQVRYGVSFFVSVDVHVRWGPLSLDTTALSQLLHDSLQAYSSVFFHTRMSSAKGY